MALVPESSLGARNLIKDAIDERAGVFSAEAFTYFYCFVQTDFRRYVGHPGEFEGSQSEDISVYHRHTF